MAPFLSFTAEEAWKFCAGQRPVDLHRRPTCDLGTPDEALLAKWARIREIRDVVNKEIETVRAAGQVGSSLQANVQLDGRRPRTMRCSPSLGDDLKFVLDHLGGRAARRRASWRSQVTPSTAVKCERCWHWRDDVGHDPAAPGPLRPLHQQPLRRRRSAQERRLMAPPAPSASPRAGGIWPWLGLALVILIVDQFTKTLILGYYKLGDADLRHQLLQHRAGPQHRRGVLLPGRCGRLAALVLHRHRRGGGDLHHLDAEVACRPEAVLASPWPASWAARSAT